LATASGAAAAAGVAVVAVHVGAATCFDVAFVVAYVKLHVVEDVEVVEKRRRVGDSCAVAPAGACVVACVVEQISRACSFAGACLAWLGGVQPLLLHGAGRWDLSPLVVVVALPLSLMLSDPPKVFLVHHHFLEALQV